MRRDMEYVIQMLKDIAKGEYKPVLYISHKFTPEFVTEEEEIENKKYIYHLEILRGYFSYAFHKLRRVSLIISLIKCDITCWV